MTVYLGIHFKLTLSLFLCVLTLNYFYQSLTTCKLKNKKNLKGYQTSRKSHDDFNDLKQFLRIPRIQNNSQHFEKVIIRVVKQKLNVPTLINLSNIKKRRNDTSLRRFQTNINMQELYRDSDFVVEELLSDMASLPISHYENLQGGTQLKLRVFYENGMSAVFKPIRFPLDKEQDPNLLHYSYFEYPRSEIAAFHLDRILGFRRALPAVGRKINMITELFDKCPEVIKNTFYRSPANNICFYGQCEWYCDIHHAVCGQEDILAGSFVAFLPMENEGLDLDIYVQGFRNPWHRKYGITTHKWERNTNFCNELRKLRAFKDVGKIVNHIDMAIFDFLIDNQDRHHFEYMAHFGRFSYNIHMDHGRAFGKAFRDDSVILTPLKQCCQINESTLKTLLMLHNGPKRLSKLMKESMINDPLAPILWEPHLVALDRRVEIVLQHVRECLRVNLEI